MCGICGCSQDEHQHQNESQNLVHNHHEEQDHLINIEENILAKNDYFAQLNKNYFLKKGILALNVMSSPGSGKTTLLAQTIKALKDKVNSAVIVGDQQTDLDQLKFQAAGAKAIQLNTGKICHLDAHMVGHALDNLKELEKIVLFIENVGNLVCPALFNLGEQFKIVILSVTEGDNKPLKYPEMFRGADLLILTKTDLLPFVDFNVSQCINYARRIKPNLEIIQLSATKNLGLNTWYEWLFKKNHELSALTNIN